MTRGAALAPSAQTESAGRQFVTFHLDGGLYGVPLVDVQEIIRVPDLAEVPLAPPVLLGLANVEGTILPVASLRRLFDLPEHPLGESMRLVVIKRGVVFGLVVDRMSTILTAYPEDIESAERLRDVTQNDIVKQFVKTPQGRVMVFDPVDLVEDAFSEVLKREVDEGPAPRRPASEASETGEHLEEERRLVSFSVNEQEYAFSVERIKEIVTLPDRIVPMPLASKTTLGMMLLRDKTLPLVSLRRLLDLPPFSGGGPERVVVTTGYPKKSHLIGVVVDAVREVLRVPFDSLEAIPSVGMGDKEELEGICQLEGGRRTVTLLEPDALLTKNAMTEHLEAERELTTSALATDREGPPDKSEVEMVVFRLEAVEMAVCVEAVREIVRVPERLTVVPFAPKFVEGIINLRGEVLPVIQLRRRLRIPPNEASDRQRILVIRARDVLFGLVVDSVVEVKKFSTDVIGPAPKLSAEQAAVVRQIASFTDTKRVVLLLEVDELITLPDGEAIASSESSRAEGPRSSL